MNSPSMAPEPMAVESAAAVSHMYPAGASLEQVPSGVSLAGIAVDCEPQSFEEVSADRLYFEQLNARTPQRMDSRHMAELSLSSSTHVSMPTHETVIFHDAAVVADAIGNGIVYKGESAPSLSSTSSSTSSVRSMADTLSSHMSSALSGDTPAAAVPRVDKRQKAEWLTVVDTNQICAEMDALSGRSPAEIIKMIGDGEDHKEAAEDALSREDASDSEQKYPAKDELRTTTEAQEKDSEQMLRKADSMDSVELNRMIQMHTESAQRVLGVVEALGLEDAGHGAEEECGGVESDKKDVAVGNELRDSAAVGSDALSEPWLPSGSPAIQWRDSIDDDNAEMDDLLKRISMLETTASPAKVSSAALKQVVRVAVIKSDASASAPFSPENEDVVITTRGMANGSSSSIIMDSAASASKLLTLPSFAQTGDGVGVNSEVDDANLFVLDLTSSKGRTVDASEVGVGYEYLDKSSGSSSVETESDSDLDEACSCSSHRTQNMDLEEHVNSDGVVDDTLLKLALSDTSAIEDIDRLVQGIAEEDFRLEAALSRLSGAMTNATDESKSKARTSVDLVAQQCAAAEVFAASVDKDKDAEEIEEHKHISGEMTKECGTKETHGSGDDGSEQKIGGTKASEELVEDDIDSSSVSVSPSVSGSSECGEVLEETADGFSDELLVEESADVSLLSAFTNCGAIYVKRATGRPPQWQCVVASKSVVSFRMEAVSGSLLIELKDADTDTIVLNHWISATEETEFDSDLKEFLDRSATDASSGVKYCKWHAEVAELEGGSLEVVVAFDTANDGGDKWREFCQLFDESIDYATCKGEDLKQAQSGEDIEEEDAEDSGAESDSLSGHSLDALSDTLSPPPPFTAPIELKDRASNEEVVIDESTDTAEEKRDATSAAKSESSAAKSGGGKLYGKGEYELVAGTTVFNDELLLGGAEMSEDDENGEEVKEESQRGTGVRLELETEADASDDAKEAVDIGTVVASSIGARESDEESSAEEELVGTFSFSKLVRIPMDVTIESRIAELRARNRATDGRHTVEEYEEMLSGFQQRGSVTFYMDNSTGLVRVESRDARDGSEMRIDHWVPEFAKANWTVLERDAVNGCFVCRWTPTETTFQEEDFADENSPSFRPFVQLQFDDATQWQKFEKMFESAMENNREVDID